MGRPMPGRCQASNPLGIGVTKRTPPKFKNFRPAEVCSAIVCMKIPDSFKNISSDSRSDISFYSGIHSAKLSDTYSHILSDMSSAI